VCRFLPRLPGIQAISHPSHQYFNSEDYISQSWRDLIQFLVFDIGYRLGDTRTSGTRTGAIIVVTVLVEYTDQLARVGLQPRCRLCYLRRFY
jgi:hypothetical protein